MFFGINKYRFEKTAILKNIGMLEYWNIGILELQFNPLNIPTNKCVNK